ncbi:bifunctional molybdopterin-guanine dinucleotide biosynthesis adaptor protein MobB/molybdopterin molybdotransferase MoeA [Halomonas sp. M20]|uniref:bifunctional molybdopterin-guanine dinucleotide biosynthesis adaptor protein MobB/molybdopterin molybdotransferase MoeA n=1 Tax=Halomonas sp. M20 TaxID=2763264 RepID=UPI002221EC24|nr:bifunctional molybdopterin-guanine dinucleotide biosynthesis adaptor protein MobB/molybdopterin molybdotransferase MoeA [Halomonas sp. M20]
MSLSCFELGERMLSIDEALTALRELTPRALESEIIPLFSSLNRVLAEDAVSPIDVPQNTNAAMDGIALSWPASTQTRFALQGDVLAGSCFEGRLEPGQAVTITTGAPLPQGADTVIMSEQLHMQEDGASRWVEIAQADRVQQGQNVRRAGEDIPRGTTALEAGTRLNPQHLGLLASLGMGEVRVARCPRVAIFSTGDEVTAPGEVLPPAGIFDSNRFSLRGLLTRLGCEVVDLGILKDDFVSIKNTLETAAQTADMVITSGGVSVGQADWTRKALDDTGRLGFWRIAIRPGRPLAFGTLGERNTPFFGLPGNPVAVMVTFLQFVQPLLRTLQGEHQWQPRRLTAIADEPLKSREGRVDFLRGIYRCDEQGRLHVSMTGRQGSGILSSMTAANCLIEIEATRAEVAQGETVTLQPFGELT